MSMRRLAIAALAALVLTPAVALAEHPSSETSIEHARALLLHGRFPAAATVLRRAVRAEEENAEAWRCLAVAYEAMQHTPEAVRAYRRYLELSPGADDVELVLGRVARLVRALGWDPGRVRRLGGSLHT